MTRQIVDIDELSKLFPFTKSQIYKLIRHTDHPLPYKKAGKRLLFDVGSVLNWFDNLPDKNNDVEV